MERTEDDLAGDDSCTPHRLDAELEALRPRVGGEGLAEVRALLLRQKFLAQEQERRRIAGELHDGICQSLTAVLLGLQVASMASTLEEVQAQLAETRRSCALAAADLRRLTRRLRVGALEASGLAAALGRSAEDGAPSSGLETEAGVAPDSGPHRG
jgi:two-component system sensor histidine kinase UhpB